MFEVKLIRATAVVFGAAFIVAIAVIIDVAITNSTSPVKVTRTSANTFHIYDPDGKPQNQIDHTCQTIGMKVGQITYDDDTWGTMDVVCE